MKGLIEGTGIRYIQRGCRRATSWVRPLPGALVIGAMRSGTTSLFAALSKHPEINTPSRKEIHFLDRHFLRGTSWYRSFFGIRGGTAFDNTPSYMVHAHSASRALQTVPDAKIIAVLRDPAERAWSHYRFRFAKMGPGELDNAIRLDLRSDPPELIDFADVREIPVLSGGFYAAQLRPWLDLFGRRRVCVIESEQLFTSPEVELRNVQEFLGLTPVDLKFDRRNAAASRESPVLGDLSEFYEASNRQLSEILDTSFSWLGGQ